MLDASRYAQNALDLTHFFAGRTHAWGLFQDRFGKVRRRFTVTIDGAWTGDEFVMDEAFRYNDGTTERRIWRIRPQTDGRFAARADGVVGEAAGRSDGPTVIIGYKLLINTDPFLIIARVDDRMHRIDENTVLSRTGMSKWGVRLGEATICFRRGAAAGSGDEDLSSCLPRCAV